METSVTNMITWDHREISQGPHYEELQELFESFWIPDMTSPEQLLLQFDLTIIPDPVLAKYMVESFYEKEAKVAKSKVYYANLIKQPWGVIDAYPPKERYEYERIKNLSRQKWIRKFPPLATVGEDAYQRLKSHSQVRKILATVAYYSNDAASVKLSITLHVSRLNIFPTEWTTSLSISPPTWCLPSVFCSSDTRTDLNLLFSHWS